MPSTVSSPFHILLLSHPKAPQSSIFRDKESHEISTPYYNASVPIWRDNLPGSRIQLRTWEEEWKKPEAAEVIEAVGAWIVSFPTPATHDDLAHLRTTFRTLQRTIEHHTISSHDAPEALVIALHVPTSTMPCLDLSSEEWEDLCRNEGGWEYIDGRIGDTEKSYSENDKGLNEFGEQVGIARLKEALEANEWESAAIDGADSLNDWGDDNTGLEMADVKVGVDMAALGKGLVEDREEGGRREELAGEEDVQALERMMTRMQAVRDLGADVPEEQRKRLAAKTVREVMRKI